MDNYREKTLEFLKSHTTAVLSTISPDGKPDAAVIYTLVDENFNFFFITKSDTTKAKNLENNNDAALTVVDPAKLTTVQVKGVIENMLVDKDYSALFFKTAEVGNRVGAPPMSKLINSGQHVLYKLVPSWLRFGDFSEKPDSAEAEHNVFHQIIPEV